MFLKTQGHKFKGKFRATLGKKNTFFQCRIILRHERELYREISVESRLLLRIGVCFSCFGLC